MFQGRNSTECCSNELVKIGGKEYELESLKVMIAAIDRYVREKCGYSVLKDKDFEVSTEWKSD